MADRARKKSSRRRNDDGPDDEFRVRVLDASDQVHTPGQSGGRNVDMSAYADRDYGFSGRCGFQEGNYSSAYGRGAAGERNTPSPSGFAGAGYDRGGTDIPKPDREPPDAVRVDDGAHDGSAVRYALELIARLRLRGGDWTM